MKIVKNSTGYLCNLGTENQETNFNDVYVCVCVIYTLWLINSKIYTYAWWKREWSYGI